MYKCLDCGNTEKFLGHAQEKGEVMVYKNDSNSKKELYEWVYRISDKNWDFNLKIDKCFFSSCNLEVSSSCLKNNGFQKLITCGWLVIKKF